MSATPCKFENVLCTRAGELASHVKEELNVAELRTAAPDEFSTMSVQPNFQALGKRLGKDMRAVKAAVQALSHEEIVAFQRDGTMTVAGHTLSREDVRVCGAPAACRLLL